MEKYRDTDTVEICQVNGGYIPINCGYILVNGGDMKVLQVLFIPVNGDYIPVVTNYFEKRAIFPTPPKNYATFFGGCRRPYVGPTNTNPAK